MRASQDSFTEQELHYLAEDSAIDIVPKFSSKKAHHISMLQGTPLDFTAVFSRPVPLWTAKSMLKQGKCRLASDECGGILSMHQDRMNIERMRRILQVERNSELPQAIGFHTLEIAEILSKECLGEVGESESIRDALLAITALRRQKLRKYLKQNQEGFLSDPESTIQGLHFTNWTQSEINFIRNFVAASTCMTAAFSNQSVVS